MASLVETKAIENDAIKFIEQSVLAESNQEVYWKSWADIMYTDKKLKPRIIVVSNFRLNVMKDTVMGHSVRQSFLLLHLISMKVGPRSNQLMLTFEEDKQTKQFNLPSVFSGQFLIEHPRVDLIAQCILFAATSIRFGRPPVLVDLPSEWFKDYQAPEPDEQDGALATYLAECDHCGIPQRVPVLDYFMTCFQIDDTMFDLKAALGFLDGKECTRDVLAIANTLKYSKWFNSFVSVDFGLKNDGCTALMSMFDVPTSISKLMLVNCKIGKPAMVALSIALAKNMQTFDHISICKTDLGDSGILALCEGLALCKHVPSSLSLANVDMGSKGCKALSKVLSKKEWTQELRVLDISMNDVGKAGTESLSEWLSDGTLLLEQCILARTNLELERLLATFRSNANLVNSALTLLDISGNKLHKKACPELCALLKYAKCLNCICLSDCHVESKQALDILDAVISNRHQLGFSLDLSKNDLGPKGARDIQQLLQDRLARSSESLRDDGIIHFLDLSDNSMGNEGITTICKALRGIALRGLKLDRNFKSSMFGKAQEAGEAIAELLNTTSTLEEFSIAGDDNSYYLGKYLYPMLHALCAHPNLRYVDFSKNRIMDDGICILADVLLVNRSLTGFNADGSRITLTGLQTLVEALKNNKNVSGMNIPTTDIDRILKSISQDKVALLQSLIHSIDIILDSNEPYHEQDVKTQHHEYLHPVQHVPLHVPAPVPQITPTSKPQEQTIVEEGTPVVEVLDIVDADVFAARQTAPRGSLLMRSPQISMPHRASIVGGSGAGGGGRTQRMSVAAASYEDMMAELKPNKTHRKMITRTLDSNVHNIQLQQQDGTYQPDSSTSTITEEPATSPETQQDYTPSPAPTATPPPPPAHIRKEESSTTPLPNGVAAVPPPAPMSNKKINIHLGRNVGTSHFGNLNQ